MTKAEEAMETLLGRTALCVCGDTLMTSGTNTRFECSCGRRWQKQMPASERWCLFQMLNKHGFRTGVFRSTECSRRHIQAANQRCDRLTS